MLECHKKMTLHLRQILNCLYKYTMPLEDANFKVSLDYIALNVKGKL